jgi:hypothetical protein
VRVWVVHEEPSPGAAEIAGLIAELRSISESSIDLPGRAEVLARKDDLIARIHAMESVPRPIPLVHRGAYPADGFEWGSTTTGATDLAHSILAIETGDEVAASVCLRFRDDIIARFSRDEPFRLPSLEVWHWIEVNRELIEREAFERPSHSVIDSPPIESTSASDITTAATASAVVSACEAAWSDIGEHHPGLPEAVIILGSGVERGRLVKLGHWWGGRWLADGEIRGEVLLAGEALHLPADKVFEVLLHEAAHGLNAARGIKDTSRGGRYHNERFASTAREVLLEVRAMRPYGLAATSLSPEALARYGSSIDRLDEAIRIARQLERAVGVGVGGDQGVEGRLGGAGQGAGESKAKGSLAAECGCGRKLRMAPSVLARGPVVCGLCGQEFSTGAEVEMPAGRDAIVDRSFLDRRRAELDTDRRASRLLEVVGRRRAQLAVALNASSHPDHPALAPLLERHARLVVLYERLNTRSPAPAVPTERPPFLSLEQSTAIDRLVGDGGDDPRLAAWYERLGTLHGEPMAAANDADAERLTLLARALLQVDGTIHGPVVEVDAGPLQVGDRVVASRQVPGGPEAGTLGTVDEADPDLGAVRIDFATWGRVRTPLVSALARSLDHDYVVVSEPFAERLSEVAVERELERLAPELEL